MSTRLNQIRDAVGLEAISHDEQQKRALSKVQEWLKKAASSPRTALSASQVLLVEGDLELPAVHQAARVVSELLSDEWGNLAKAGQQMLALKVLVAAAWEPKTMCHGNYRALALASSALWTHPTRQLTLRPFLEELLKELTTASTSFPDGTWNIDAAKAPPKFDAASFSDAIKAEVIAHPLQAAAQEKLAGTLTLHAATLAGVRTALEALRSVTLGLPGVVDAKLKALASSVDIVWWGQARYCAYQRKPYRQLDSAGSKRWWAALGLAECADASHVESAASFLVEMLLDLDVAADEVRTLSEWLEELHETLKRGKDAAPRIRKQMAAHVDECAVSLPITWLRMHVDDPFNANRIQEVTTLDIAEKVPSWQWTSWMLRECMLEELLGD